MASSSRSDIIPIVDVDSDVDDFYYPSHDKDGSFPISGDQEYAEELQFQEALIYSISHTNSSSLSKKDSPSSSKNVASSSSSPLISEISSSSNKLKRKRPLMAKSETEQSPNSFCGICMDTKPQSEMFSNGKACRHHFCSDCIRQYVSVKIKENITKVTCPDPNCKKVIRPELCKFIVPKEVLERWEDVLCESSILATQKFYCPFKDCSAMLVNDGGKTVTSSECPNCNRLFCAKCKVTWHSGMNCKEFKRLEKGGGDMILVKLATKQKWKRCPKCKFYVEKRSGCHHIICRCGHQFCYGCGRKYGDNHRCRFSHDYY